MKKLILTYGAIAGLIVSLMLLLAFTTSLKDSNYAELIGYSSMIIAFATIFFAIKSYRDEFMGGSISFMTALKIGLGISLVASLIYIFSWLIISNTIAKDFAAEYFQQSVDKLYASDLGEEEITQRVQELEKFREIYKNPVIMIGITFLEIFPVGLIISLISAFVLKKK